MPGRRRVTHIWTPSSAARIHSLYYGLSTSWSHAYCEVGIPRYPPFSIMEQSPSLHTTKEAAWELGIVWTEQHEVSAKCAAWVDIEEVRKTQSPDK